MIPDEARFIAHKIVAEAAHEGVPLSEVESKMLLFSETSPTLPDMAEVNEVFDRDYDQQQYEGKIAGLIANIRRAERKDAAADKAWTAAIKRLRSEDYYFMVMLNEVCGRERPRGDWVRLIVTALLIVSVFLVIVIFATGK